MEQEVRALWLFEGSELDERSHELRVGGELVKVEPKALSLLLVLLRHSGEVVTNEEILNAVWPGRLVGPQAVANLVSKVRQALGDERSEIIRTVTRAGYRLVAKVTRSTREPAGLPAIVESAPAQHNVGDTVRGRENWVLTRSFGKGGFGDVWLAEHQKTGEMRVFKFCDSSRLYGLKREVTIFRLLNDAIGDGDYVRILDWNFDQEPFFIESEYAGLNLRAWAESQGGVKNIPMRMRLDLIARVAEAVAAAHSVGVLHKDLKPENILIDSSEAQRVTLADFGAGRVLDEARLADLGITQLGFTQTMSTTETSGTLFYMAPELLQANAVMPSLQSDIYALGVMLYQLAAGDFGKPLSPGWESDVDDEILRLDIGDATHGNPARRMQSATELANRLRSISARHVQLQTQRVNTARLAEAQKALETDRARRPWLLAAVVALGVGWVGSGTFYFREREQKRIAEAYGAFVNSDIVKAADPLQGGNPKISLKSAVARAAPRIQERFGSDPDIEVAVSQNLSTTLETVNEFRAAAALRRREIAISEANGGAGGRRRLGFQVALERDLIALSDEPGARKLAAETKPGIDALSADDPLAVDSHYADAQIAAQFDPPSPKTVKMFEDLLGAARTARVPIDDLSRMQRTYLVALENMENWPALEQEARKQVQQFTKDFGADSPRTLFAQIYLGKALLGQHKLAEAESLLAEPYRTLLGTYGPDYGETRTAAEGLSQLYYQQGRWVEAVPLDEEIHAGELADGGSDTPWSIEKLGWIGRDRAHAGKLEAADEASRQAAEDARRVFGPQSIMYAENLVIRAQVQMDMKRWSEAAAAVAELAALPPEATGDDNNWAGRLLFLQAQIAVNERNYAAARRMAQQALEDMTAAVGPEDMDSRLVANLLHSIPRP